MHTSTPRVVHEGTVGECEGAVEFVIKTVEVVALAVRNEPAIVGMWWINCSIEAHCKRSIVVNERHHG